MATKYEITKTDVRRDFSHVRLCMRRIEQMLNEGVRDFSNGGELNQTVLEAIASLSVAEMYVLERRGE